MQRKRIESGTIMGYLYFYIHFITEVACFFFLARIIGDSAFLWVIPLLYDMLAFVPQSLIGYLNDKYPKINFALIGIFLMILALIVEYSSVNLGYLTGIVLLCLGNACVHVSGARSTLLTSKGKLAPSAIFVAGGSFGVITGKIFGSMNIPYYFIIFMLLSAIPFVLLAKTYENENDSCEEFNYNNPKIKVGYVIILAVFVVIVRGYMGYGLPTSWNKTLVQNIIFYCFMGIGKAMGGILSDKIGMKKVAFISTIGALPLLLIGDKIMIISLVGVLLFSMTMSITLALLVSCLKRCPGLAFGLTTIGLFLGTVPIFIFRISDFYLNAIVIVVLTIVCVGILNIIIRGEDNG